SGALGFRVDFNHPTENVMLKLSMSESDAHYFEESQLSKDQKIEKLDNGMSLISATVPFTSQLVWWLRSFGKKIKHIEPSMVSNAVSQMDERSEEHTSELQSRENLVCRLLLEKKKSDVSPIC